MQIITNHKPRPIVYGYELTEKQKADFDYLTAEDLEINNFIIYRGQVYDLSEFTRAPDNLKTLNYDGIHTESFFSGLLIKLDQHGDAVTVARYYS